MKAEVEGPMIIPGMLHHAQHDHTKDWNEIKFGKRNQLSAWWEAKLHPNKKAGTTFYSRPCKCSSVVWRSWSRK